MKAILRVLVPFIFCVAVFSCGGQLPPPEEPLKQQLLVDEARLVIDNFMADPNMGWFREHLKSAKGVLIVPNLYKGAWFLGGSGGRGLILVRDEESGEWFGPAFSTMGSLSLGFQLGGQRSEMVVLAMTQKGLDSLHATSVKIGGDVSGAIGPVGATAQAATAPSLNVDFISYGRSQGAFLGVSLDGAVIKENYDWNKRYYGKPVRPVDILVSREVTNPRAQKLRADLSKAQREG